MNYTKDIGNFGEDIAKKYFLDAGYIYITRNVKSSHREIDLIFKIKNETIFVEVKTRIINHESLKETPISRFQAKNLQHAILDYSIKNKINLDYARLDLIVILIDKNKRCCSIRHYKNII